VVSFLRLRRAERNSVSRRTIFLPVLLLALASSLLLALLVTSSAGSAPSTTCSAAQKAQRQAAVRAYQAKMQAARKAYFKTHKRVSLRAAFVKTQQAKLTRLRQAAACVVSQPAPPSSSPATTPTATTATGPVPAPPPGANEPFSFDSGITPADQDQITGDVAYAVQDEALLLGAPITSVSTFVSSSPNWLADQECRFWGHGGDCVQQVEHRWASGGTTAVGGTGGIFLYWAAPSWGYGASENQKIIAHELFHVFQYQLDKLVNNGSTPSSQVRPSGPVWLDEGAPEMVGYHVAADRRLFPSYASVLANQISRAKQISTPLSSLQTHDEAQIPSVYSLFHVAVDHLVSIGPAGLPALTAYYNALGAGMAWQDAFQAAFGMSVDAYYANFAAYRAGL
jgi:hypothetical protein